MNKEDKFVLMVREQLIAGLTSIKKFTNIQQHHTASPRTQKYRTDDDRSHYGY